MPNEKEVSDAINKLNIYIKKKNGTDGVQELLRKGCEELVKKLNEISLETWEREVTPDE